MPAFEDWAPSQELLKLHAPKLSEESSLLSARAQVSRVYLGFLRSALGVQVPRFGVFGSSVVKLWEGADGQVRKTAWGR